MLTVGDAGPKGLGLFAKCEIPEGMTIGTYEGELLTAKQYMRRYPTGDSIYTFQLNDRAQRRDLLYLDARDPSKSNLTRYINHEANIPNLIVSIEEVRTGKGIPVTYAVFFTSTRAISAGEELSFDYGDKYKIS